MTSPLGLREEGGLALGAKGEIPTKRDMYGLVWISMANVHGGMDWRVCNSRGVPYEMNLVSVARLGVLFLRLSYRRKASE
jgi:hypothetical protein